MKTIKFRAFKNDKFIFSENYGLARFFDKLMEFDEVQQYTGLKDKNGKEVYEGDIVLFPNNRKVHIVDFYQSGFVLKSVDGQIVVYNIKPQYIEVVGNIYENPELC